MANDWIDILDEQPKQGERLLVKLIGGAVRITSYDRFDYQQWGVKLFKRIPNAQRQHESIQRTRTRLE